MANIIKPIICGVDVSQETLDIASSDILVERIPNTAPAIREWLGSLPAGTHIAIEATGSYHEALLEHGLEAGYEVFIVNGKQLHHYREAVGPRAKTDTHDALLLRRYLCHEYGHLTPVKPLNNQHKRLWRLLKRRAMLVKVRTQLRASMKGDPEVQALSEGVVKELERTIRQVENLMRSVVKTLGLEQDLQHCRSVPGIGPVNALALVACFHRGAFQRVSPDRPRVPRRGAAMEPGHTRTPADNGTERFPPSSSVMGCTWSRGSEQNQMGFRAKRASHQRPIQICRQYW